MNIKTTAFLLIIAALGIVVYAACSSPKTTSKKAYSIAEVKNGYVLTVPNDIMKGFPDKTKISVGLEDEKHGKTAVVGMGLRVSDNSFRIDTADRLKFLPSRDNELKTWLLIHSDPLASSSTCSGCPRDSKLQIYGDETICWCWADNR
jgi:hypothetical protein